MAIEKERTEFILEKTKTNQSSDISEGVQSRITWPRHPGRVETSLAGLIEQRSVLITQVDIHPLRSVSHPGLLQGCLGGHDGRGGGQGGHGGGR